LFIQNQSLDNNTNETVRAHSLNVKCLVDNKLVIKDNENYVGNDTTFKLPDLGCTPNDPYFVAEVTNPRYLYAAFATLPNSSSIEITNKICDSLKHLSLETINVTKITTNVRAIFFETSILSDCIALFLQWFTTNFDSKHLQTFKTPSKLTITSFFGKEFNQLLKQSPMIQGISLNGKFIMDPKSERLFEETSLLFLTELELTNSARIVGVSDSFVANILLDLQNSPLRKISISPPVLGKQCHYYSHFENTLTDLFATIDIESSSSFDFSKCFEDVTEFERISIKLESNDCHLPSRGSILIKGVNQEILKSKSLIIALTSHCKLLVDDSTDVDYEAFNNDGFNVISFSNGPQR